MYHGFSQVNLTILLHLMWMATYDNSKIHYINHRPISQQKCDWKIAETWLDGIALPFSKVSRPFSKHSAYWMAEIHPVKNTLLSVLYKQVVLLVCTSNWIFRFWCYIFYVTFATETIKLKKNCVLKEKILKWNISHIHHLYPHLNRFICLS